MQKITFRQWEKKNYVWELDEQKKQQRMQNFKSDF